MKILITGATGFIGQNLIKSLQSGNHTIYVIVRANSDTSIFNKEINIFKYNGDIDILIDFFKKERFDGIVHLASLFLASHSLNDTSNLISSNIKFGTELLEVSKNTDVKWFLNTGTFWQNYKNESYNPVNLYAATKEAFETIARYYTETSNLIFTTIKLNDTFGPNDTRNKIFNIWYKISQSAEELKMSKGEQIIDISYIDDVVNAYIVMIDNLNKNDLNKYKNKTFVVSNRDRMSLKELSKIFEEITHKSLNIKWGGRDYREREVMTPYLDGVLVPNWKQQYTLKEAIKNTIKGMKNEWTRRVKTKDTE